ncbi:IS1/IS1595 family N-terminal zinc-binding domain-containing protein [Tenacibaculum tangerinum]
MKYIKCISFDVIRKGRQNSKPRFYCKDCKKYFQLEYIYQA